MRVTRLRPRDPTETGLQGGEFGALCTTGVSRWIISIGLAAVPTVFNLWVTPTVGPALFLSWVPAIMLAGFLAGLAPGLLVLALSIFTINYLWTEPTWSLSIARRSDWLALLLCSLAGIAVLGLSIAARVLLLRSRSMRKRLYDTLTVAQETQEQLREADRRKDEFLATLAHELRNPMAPIRYAAATLKPGMPEAALQQARAVIERQSVQMTRLLDDLLDMSRITRNVIELKRSRVDLDNLIKEVVELATPLLSELRHRLLLTLPPEPPIVFGDPTRLLQIFGNLLDNAAKYTPPGGLIEVCVQTRPGRAIVGVKDNGIGLSAEMLPRVFELFSRLHKSLKTSGLGIGLTVVKRLVELHGGGIEVASAGLGRGAEFIVQLPLAAAAQQPGPGEVLRRDNVVSLFNSERPILIVDDNQDATEALATLLRYHGYPVRVAFSGEAALRAVDEARPAVILLDIGLPDVSGTDVARHVRNRADGDKVRIIAITGWGQEVDRSRTRAAGIDWHLVKPVDPDELLALLAADAAATIGAPARAGSF